MRLLSPALIASFVVLGSDAAAGGDEVGPWYFEFGAGSATLEPAADDNIEFDTGFILHGLLGRRMGALACERAWWGLEVEALYTLSDIANDPFLNLGSSTSDELARAAVLGNLSAEWRWGANVALVGALGAGYAPTLRYDSLNDGSSSFVLDEESAFAWQGKLGLRYGLGEHYSWILSYRYLVVDTVDLVDDSIGTSFELEQRTHAVEIGVRWTF
jgi:opacity protein-like surface antigen